MVAQGITSTGGADFIVTKLLGTPKDTMLAQVRMCLITALFSSFVNDTPVVGAGGRGMDCWQFACGFILWSARSLICA